MSPIVSKCYIHVYVNWWPFFKRLPIACADDLYFEWLALTEPSVTAAKVTVAKEIGRQMWIPSTWHHCTLVPLWYLAPLFFGATMVPGSSVWWGTRWRGTPPTWGGLGWLQQGQWHQHRQEEEVYPLPFCCVQSSCWMLPKGLRVQQEEVYPLTFCCVHCTELLLYPLTF